MGNFGNASAFPDGSDVAFGVVHELGEGCCSGTRASILPAPAAVRRPLGGRTEGLPRRKAQERALAERDSAGCTAIAGFDLHVREEAVSLQKASKFSY